MVGRIWRRRGELVDEWVFVRDEGWDLGEGGMEGREAEQVS